MLENTTCESVLWLRLNEKVLCFPCIFAAVYFPHEKTPYYNNILDCFSDELMYVPSHYDLPLYILRKSSARTGVLNDCLEFDGRVAESAWFYHECDDFI